MVLDAILNSLHWTMHFKVVVKYGWTKTKLKTIINQIGKHLVEGNQKFLIGIYTSALRSYAKAPYTKVKNCSPAYAPY